MAESLNPFQKTSVPFSRPQTPEVHAALQIGFVGLGAMGYHMATNLAKHQASLMKGDPPLLVWNRTLEKAEKLQSELGKDKVLVAQNLEQIATQCDVIITNLANDTVVKSVYEQFTAALKNAPPTHNKIFVETSTILPSLAGELDTLVSSIPHSHLVTSPVFGAPAAAAKAALIIIMGGEYRSKKQVAYILCPAIGRKVVDVGGNLEKAPTFKLIGNSVILGQLEILAEAYTLAEKAGIDAERVHNLITELLPAPIIVSYSDKMLNDKFDGNLGFGIEGGIKDASHIRTLTAKVNAPMPVIDVAHQHLLTARAIHQTQLDAGTCSYPNLDWTGLIAGVRVAAGLDGFDQTKHTSVVREDE